MKTKVLSKVLSCTLAFAMTLGLIACGSEPATEKETPSSSSAAEASAQESSSVELEEEREHVELVVYNYVAKKTAGMEETIEAVNEYLKEKLNTTIDLHLYEGVAEYNSTVSTILSSGSPIDILFTGAGRVDFSSFAEKNAFVPIEDYVDEYLADMEGQVPEAAWEAYTLNEHLYAVPLARDFAKRYNFQLNQTMLDDLGLSFTAEYDTIFDMVDFLYEVKAARDAKYPEKAGQPIIKITASLPAFFYMEPIVSKNTMVVANIPGIDGFAGMGNGETVFCPYLTEEYKEYAKLPYQLVKDGIMPLDTVNFDTDKVIERAGELIGKFSIGDVYVDEDVNAPYYTTKMYAAKNSFNSTATLQGGGYAIAATSEHVERCLEVINLLNTDTYLSTIFRFGPEGVGWTDEDNNNIIELTELNSDASNRYWYNWYGWNLGGLLSSKVVEGYPENFTELLADMNNNATATANIGFNMNLSPVENEIAACSSVIAEYHDSVILYGQNSNVEELVDEFVAKLKANGIEKIVEEAQSQLDAWRAERGLTTK